MRQSKGRQRSKPKKSEPAKVRLDKKMKPLVVSRKPLDQIYSMLRRKKLLIPEGRKVLADLTVDLDELARKAEKIPGDRTGRRGKNPFRAYPWIGM